MTDKQRLEIAEEFANHVLDCWMYEYMDFHEWAVEQEEEFDIDDAFEFIRKQVVITVNAKIKEEKQR